MQTTSRFFWATALSALLAACGNPRRPATVPVAKTDSVLVSPASSASSVPSNSPPASSPTATPKAGENYTFPLNDVDAMKVVEGHCLRCHSSFRTLDNVKKSSSDNAKSLANATMPKDNTSWAKSQLGVELKKWFEKNSR